MDQAIVFGKYDHLLGVANIVNPASNSTEALNDNIPQDNKQVAMILMTAGMLHSVGPYRMYVDIANSLAEKGISSLRFDLSGIGESLGVGSVGKSIDRAAMEASEAMDYMSEKQGIKDFILFGLCSGADDSIQAALKDKRVKGVIALDGLGYKTSRSKFNQFLLLTRKMLRIKKWIRKISHLTEAYLAPASLAVGSDVREFPETAEQASQELQQLVDQKTQLHFIYTGGTEYYNYAEQFYDMLPKVNWNGNESTTYFPHMDHVVLLCEDRKELVDHVTEKAFKMAVS